MLYIDSSAIVKLVVREPESGALVGVVQQDPTLVSSALALTEVTRAIVRAGRQTERAASVLAGIALVPVDDGILRAAGTLRPATLRTLDAIHLATALSLRADVSYLLTYDDRLAEAARGAGVEVLAPGGQSTS